MRGLALAASVVLVAGCATAPARRAESPRASRPKVEVRASPRMAFGPVNALLRVELLGGDDVEEFYCPRVEWDFGDGSKAVRESDCEPWQPGTSIERRFSMWHCYRPGEHPITVSLWRANRKLVQATTSVTVLVRAGGGRC